MIGAFTKGHSGLAFLSVFICVHPWLSLRQNPVCISTPRFHLLRHETI
jgi:hypothetical protein